MDLYAKPLAGIATQMDGESMIIQFEAQGGLQVRVHMEESEWGWLAAILAEKRKTELGL